MKKTIITLGTVMCLFLFASCVSITEHRKLEEEYNLCQKNLRTIKASQKDLQKEFNAEKNKGILTKAELQNIEAERDKMAIDVRNKRKQIGELQDELDKQQLRYQEMVSGKSKDLQMLSEELEESRQALAKRAKDLEEKEKSFKILQQEFAAKEEKLSELQTALKDKEQEVQSIRDKVTEALLGFTDKGLSINQVDGKVYVSMDEKLLFKSGSWTVAEEGVKALKEVANVLAINTDINVTVEGHTDNQLLNSRNQVKDNWDLSVMRATSIVKILLQEADIDPTRIIPSGRGQYIPIEPNETAAQRAKNRRTELILTPKVSELLKILN